MAQQSDPLSLRIGYWVAVHSAKLRTWWAISIIAIDVLLIVIFVVTFMNFSFSTDRTSREMVAMSQPLVSSGLRQRLEPTALETGDAVALSRGGGRYDLVVPVSNTNTQWAAVEVHYNFTFGIETREEVTSLWPGQQAYLTELNVAGSQNLDRATLTVHVTNVVWRRPPDLSRYKDIIFSVANEKLVPVTGLTGGGTATRYSATVKNNSVYGVKHLRFGIVLKNDSAIVAANEATFPTLDSFEERTLEVTWLGGLPLSSVATVYPIIDLLDSQSYLEAR